MDKTTSFRSLELCSSRCHGTPSMFKKMWSTGCSDYIHKSFLEKTLRKQVLLAKCSVFLSKNVKNLDKRVSMGLTDSRKTDK